jgi:hypothetical protein
VPYETTISALDLSGGVSKVRITAGYIWSVAGGGLSTMSNVTLDVDSIDFLSATTPVTFGYAGSLAPPPASHWDVALWIQEIAGIPHGAGWLFRSGGFQTEPPSEPIEVILAPEELLAADQIAASVGPLPITSGTTTITAITPVIVGKDVMVTADGSDTRIPSGITFTYTMTLVLAPNDNIRSEAPFRVRLANAGLHFNAAPGTGFGTAILNSLADLLEGEIAPQVTATINGLVNAGVLSQVATRLNLGTPASMPAGVVMSIRSVRATTRQTAAGATENVIGVRAALAGFGGVSNKFPALSDGSRCFVATAALDPNAPELQALRKWRELRLRHSWLGRLVLMAYDRVAPRLAWWVRRSERRRAAVRALVVAPGARLAHRSLRRAAK